MIDEETIEGYLFSTDKNKLDLKTIHRFLSEESYWSENIPIEIVSASISGSLCFGVYTGKSQIGFARVITDHVSFGYLADVFILKEHRNKGLSKHLMQFIMSNADVKKFRRFMLATKDAHSLYKQFGFTPLAEPDRFMEIKAFEKYNS